MVGGGRAGVIAVGVRGSRRWHIESPSTEFELVGAMAVGEQAVVTDAMETGWEDVEQEAAHELADVETHDLAPMTAVLAIVLPAETDMGRVEIEQTAVGDGDAMRRASSRATRNSLPRARLRSAASACRTRSKARSSWNERERFRRATPRWPPVLGARLS